MLPTERILGGFQRLPWHFAWVTLVNEVSKHFDGDATALPLPKSGKTKRFFYCTVTLLYTKKT